MGCDPFTYRIPCFNFYCAMGESSYVSILLKMSTETAKIIHNEMHSRVTIFKSRCKYGLVSSCLSSGYSPAQLTFCQGRHLQNEKMRFLRPLYAINYFLFFTIRKRVQ